VRWQPQGVSPDTFRHGPVRFASAWLGTDGYGCVRLGYLLMISALRASALSAGFLGTQTQRGVVWWGSDGTGDVWTGDVWLGGVWFGAVMQGLQTAVRRASAFPTALSGADMVMRVLVWRGGAPLVGAWSGY